MFVTFHHPPGRDRCSAAVAWPALLTVLIWAGCAGRQSPEQQAAETERLEVILSEPLDADEYAPPRRCISQFVYRDFDALGDRYVLFEGPGDTLWLNELHGRCPGLARADALAFDNRGGQLCEFDRFKITDWFHSSRFQRWPWDWLEGIPCTLGKFRPVTPGQVQALRGALADPVAD